MKAKLKRIVSMLTRLAMRSDRVSESPPCYNSPVIDYEHEHEHRFLDVATLKYEVGRLTGANSASWATGFTITRIDVLDQQRTRLAVSAPSRQAQGRESPYCGNGSRRQGPLAIDPIRCVSNRQV